MIATAMSAGARSGMIIFKQPTQLGVTNSGEVITFEGVDGAPGTRVQPTYQWIESAYGGSNGLGLNGIGNAPMPVDTWFAVVWNIANPTTFQAAIIALGGTFAPYSTLNPGGVEYQGLLPPTPGGLRLGYGSSQFVPNTVISDWRYGPIFLCSTPQPLASWQAVIDAIA